LARVAKHNRYMPLWVGDYLIDTPDLTFEQHGVYLLLIMEYWRRGEPLPDDDAALARILRTNPRKWRSVRPMVERFFRIGDGVWRHARIDTELEAARDRSAKATEAANRRYEPAQGVEHSDVSRSIQPRVARESTLNQPRLDDETGGASVDSQGKIVDLSICSGDATHSHIEEKHQSNGGLPKQIDLLASGGGSPHGASAARLHRLPACPVREIVAAFHELMPRNPRVRILTETLAGHIRQRWRDLRTLPGWEYDATEAGLEMWRRFFTVANESKFLTGQTSGTNGRPPFVADLAWMMRPTNFAKILENKYHREAAA
jgi:uncharacterized protein YdaU (DUF1376 family)